MDNICRFCLSVSNQEMCKLTEECVIYTKIRPCLPINISLDESLPNKLCKECVNKTEQIYEFCTTIKENEVTLRQYLVNGSLQDFYLKLTNDIHVKEEKNDLIIFCESKYLKNGDSYTKESVEEDIGIDKKEDKKKLNIIECMKIEETVNDDFNDTPHSSDDEITLSSIKKDKENSKAPKRLKRIRTQKNSKTKNRNVKETQKNADLHIDNIKQYTCLTCVKICDSQTDLIKHYHNEHLNRSRSTLKQKYTETECDGTIIYKCDGCEKTCTMKKDIVKHVAVHNEERPLICKLCGRMYKTVTEIIRHSRVHNGFKLQCSYKCGYTTAYQGALKEHENRHLDVYKYTCEKCGKGFYVKTWYEQHQNIHNGLKPFVCDICGLSFHMARYLTAHRSLIHPQSSSVKRYICVHCNQKCDSANSLALHLEEHGINKEKEFLCDFCGKILSSADQLKYHHRMHSGVKPYSCSICNKTFAKKFNVKVHMSSHSGEKTHACVRCGKRYTQRSTLLRHLKRHHTGSSPTRTG